MAKYTIELCDVVSECNIFGFSYPFYDEKKRFEFEKAFIRHFYFREICCPTIEQFLVFLQDKMFTVFPYYNELFRTATIKYDIENPYNLTETYKRKVNTAGKTRGSSSAVGQVFDTNNTETNERRNDSHSENVSGEGTNTQKTVSSEDIQKNNNGKSLEKFLDTPQGAVNVDDPNYLTSLKGVESEGTEQSATESESTTTGSSSTKQSTTGTDSSTNNGTVKVEGERKTTEDAANRQESQGEEIEEYTMIRKGNIGVNPASFEIDKHIDTQKTLQRIYQMFFDECEDLFMMVY